jgi:hypothetical protein
MKYKKFSTIVFLVYKIQWKVYGRPHTRGSARMTLSKVDFIVEYRGWTSDLTDNFQ